MSTNYTREWTLNAPVRRNSYFDFLNSAPGVSQTSYRGTTTSATSLGSSTNENSHLDRRREHQLVPLVEHRHPRGGPGASARGVGRVGGVQGAVFNVVTRQGSNVLHGDFNYYYQNDALTARNTEEELRQRLAVSPRPVPRHHGPGHRPVHRDKLWFFGSLRVPAERGFAARRPIPHPGKTTTKRWFWKFNYNITANIG